MYISRKIAKSKESDTNKKMNTTLIPIANIQVTKHNTKKDETKKMELANQNIVKDHMRVTLPLQNPSVKQPIQNPSIKQTTQNIVSKQPIYKPVVPRNIIYGNTIKIDNKNLKFIHITKTGGETIEILTGLTKNHNPAKLYKFNNDDYIFTFIRNPYTRLYSWYNHLRKYLYVNELKNIDGLGKESQSLKDLLAGVKLEPQAHGELALRHDFKDWVMIMMKEKEKYKEPIWGPLGTQYEMLFDDNGVRLVHDIYYFEDFTNEASRLFKKIKREELIPKITVTNQSVKKQNPKDVYDNELLKVVYEHFKVDFITFNYKPFII